MNRPLRIISLFGCAVLGVSAGAEPVPSGNSKELEEAIALLEESFSAWEPQAFDEPVQRLQRLCQTSTAPEFWHWAAVAQFHHILCRESQGSKPLEGNCLEKAVRTLDRALILDPQNAECHTMRGILLGMRISRQLAAALWLGPKLMSDQRLALEQGRDNPRVRYLHGISIYRASKGKDASKALGELLEAERLFQAEANGAGAPLRFRWGFDHCLYLTGDLYRSEGDSAKAVEYYSKALHLNPRLRQAQTALRQLTGS